MPNSSSSSSSSKPASQSPHLTVFTTLKDSGLKIHSFSGREELGRPFVYDLRLWSTKNDIDFTKMVGENIAVRLDMKDQKGEPRWFNGYISRFVQEGHGERQTSYRATVVPWLWFLSRAADCRIFQEKSIPDIVKEVCKLHGFTDIELNLKDKYDPWEYCVQYRETDFNFISRLLEQEGIYYYFKHEAKKHTLVLCDQPASHAEYPGYEKIVYMPSWAGSARERLSEWTIEQMVQPGSVILNDFNFKTPETELLATHDKPWKHAAGAFKVFDYPAEYEKKAEGDKYAKIRFGEYETQHERISVAGDVRGLAVGHIFEAPGHLIESQKNRKYLVTSATYHAESHEGGFSGSAKGGESLFHVSAEVMDKTIGFRPARTTPKPTIAGPQTAIVAGPSGEEIHVDEHGRIKLQFHWDRASKGDDKSSCWVRVAQMWAGKGWGSISTPRIGQEVVVEFLEGDPDQPIVTGRVYNGVNKPPYALPGMKTISGTKSNSSKGGGGFNEIRFEDKKGEEQIFIHGEKQLDIRIKQDAYEWIGKTQHLIVVEDQFEEVQKNKHLKVAEEQRVEVGKDFSLAVKGKSMIKVVGASSVTVQDAVHEDYKADQSTKVAQNLSIAAMGVVIEGSTGITLKCGGSSIVLDASGVTIKGAMVTLDGSMTKINSGPGSSPQSAKAPSAAAPQAPTAPKEADKADPGEMEKIKAAQKETKGAKYSAVDPKPKKSDDAKPEERKTWFQFQVWDAAGKPMPDVKVRVKLSDGSSIEKKSNGDGWIKVEDKKPEEVTGWELVDHPQEEFKDLGTAPPEVQEQPPAADANADAKDSSGSTPYTEPETN
ncbi:MAG: type VI secretion system tip protein TssI/VgrG [Planctomycetota bacterium]|nr:type VI secretion system tip protein TssI/VgrG [Planctomycetota bacterium]